MLLHVSSYPLDVYINAKNIKLYIDLILLTNNLNGYFELFFSLRYNLFNILQNFRYLYKDTCN